MADFKKLHVWQKSKDLSVSIYKLADNEKFSKDFGFRDQIRRAAVSVPSNIAEGDELDSSKQSVRHFYIAKDSIAEIITQLIIASETGYIQKEEAQNLIDQYEHVSLMLYKLIKARSTSQHRDTAKP